MKRHRLDAISLVSGLFFAAFGSLYVAGALDATMFQLRWLAAGALIVLGLALALGGSHEEGEEDRQPG